VSKQDKGIWDALCHDPYLELQGLKNDKNFRAYVEMLPQKLRGEFQANAVLSPENLVAAQYHAISLLAEVNHTVINQLVRLLRDYTNFCAVLYSIDETILDHCRKCTMTETEISAMERGEIQLEAYIVERPGVILAPLLSRMFRVN
jgi:hypothetical protein